MILNFYRIGSKLQKVQLNSLIFCGDLDIEEISYSKKPCFNIDTVRQMISVTMERYGRYNLKFKKIKIY